MPSPAHPDRAHPDHPRRDGLVQWLFLEKQLNHWKSTKATAEAIYSLVYTLDREGELGTREAAQLTVGPRVAHAGTYKIAPAQLQSMYAPEFAAYSAGHRVDVEP